MIFLCSSPVLFFLLCWAKKSIEAVLIGHQVLKLQQVTIHTHLKYLNDLVILRLVKAISLW